MTAVSPDVKLTESPKPPSLWRNKAFNLLWGSQALSGLGTSMSALATPLLTLYVTGSPIKAGLVGTCYAVTRLVVQMPSGVLADRVDRRWLMLTCDSIRLLTFGLLGWAVLTDRVTLLWIIATAVVAGLFGARNEARQAAITPDRLQGRVISVIITLAMALASMSALVAGAFLTWFGAPLTILALSGIMVISAVTATFSKGMRSMQPLTETAPA